MSDFKKEILLSKEESTWEGNHITGKEDCNKERTEQEEGEVLDSSVEESSFILKGGRDLLTINEVSEDVKNFPLTEAIYCKLGISKPLATGEVGVLEQWEKRRKDRLSKVACKDRSNAMSRKSIEIVKIVRKTRRRSSLLGSMQGKFSSVAKYFQSPRRIFGQGKFYNLNSTLRSAKKKRISLMISSSDSPGTILKKVKEKQEERKPWSSVLTPKKEIMLNRDSSVAVADTNIFLHKLDLLKRMVQLSKVIFVPMVVHRELDGLKKNWDLETARLARSAGCWLNKELRGRMVVGQGLGEETRAINKLRYENNDDKILASCLYLKCQVADVLLVTDDRILENKALSSKLQVVGSSKLIERI